MNNLFLILGVLGLLISGFLFWWFHRKRMNETEEIMHHSEHYFDEELIDLESNRFEMERNRLETDRKIEPLLEPPVLDEPFETPEKIEEREAELPKKKELLIVLYVVARRSSGFSGTDVFSALKEQGLNYGKMKIFHHHGIGELKVKDSIFSIANIMEPGTFDPRKMEEFKTMGLVLFMRLPGPFGGRVAFELMLNTAQRIAEILEGEIKDEKRRPLVPNIIDDIREKISDFEKN